MQKEEVTFDITKNKGREKAMYRKVFLCGLVVSLILAFLSGPCSSKGFHLGIISAVKEKIGELKEKTQEQTAEVTHYESTTAAGGIAQFTLENGETASVKAIDQRTGDPLSGIDAYLITNGVDGAYLLVDPGGEHAPRIVNAVSPAPASSEWIGLIREVCLAVYGRFTGDHPAELTVDRIPPGLNPYLVDTFFNWWRDSTFGEINFDLNEWISDFVVDKAVDFLLDISTPIGWAVGAWEIIQTIQYQYWATYYYNLNYEPSDECEIWHGKPNIFGYGFTAVVLVLPKDPPDPCTQTGSISGKVTDARTGEGLANVELALFPSTLDTWSQLNGSYLFSNVPVISNMQPPYYTITATKVGYDRNSVSDIQVYANTVTSNVNITLNPIVGPGGGEYRIVLTWGANPQDLDSHLWTPSIGGSTYHLYWITEDDYDDLSLPPYADLDLDVIISYGPETTTIGTVYSGTYTYAVHHYSGSGTLTTSEAAVKIYDEVGLIDSFAVPTTGSGVWWRVFTLDGSTGQITAINTITNDPPIAYTLIPSRSK